MNTRIKDIERLDSDGYKNLRDKVYKQSKNGELERLRKLLIEAENAKDWSKASKIAKYISERRWE